MTMAPENPNKADAFVPIPSGPGGEEANNDPRRDDDDPIDVEPAAEPPRPQEQPNLPTAPDPHGHAWLQARLAPRARSSPARAPPRRVDHTYRDYSNFPPADLPGGAGGSGRVRAPTNFPSKLHQILSTPEYESIVSWMPHGRAWKVHSRELLVSTVLPNHFAQSKYESFSRQLNGWGFKRLHQAGNDYGAYYHEAFLRGLPHLTALIRRARPNRGKLLPHVEGEPNFYEIDRQFPLPGPAATPPYQGGYEAAGHQNRYETTHPNPESYYPPHQGSSYGAPPQPRGPPSYGQYPPREHAPNSYPHYQSHRYSPYGHGHYRQPGSSHPISPHSVADYAGGPPCPPPYPHSSYPQDYPHSSYPRGHSHHQPGYPQHGPPPPELACPRDAASEHSHGSAGTSPTGDEEFDAVLSEHCRSQLSLNGSLRSQGRE